MNCTIMLLSRQVKLDLNEFVCCYPRRSRSAIGVDIVLILDVCMFVCLYVSALERKRLIGMT